MISYSHVRMLVEKEIMMGESSEAEIVNGNEEDTDEEYNVRGKAAMVLVSFKHLKLDEKSAKALNDSKRKTLCRIRPNPNAKTKHKALQIQYSAVKVKPIAAKVFLEGYNPPDIPPVPSLNGLIGMCSKPFVKQLTESDVRDDQSRLSINKVDVQNFLLPLLNGDERPSEGIPVTTFDVEGNAYPMVFKLWGSKAHVLIKGWKAFFRKHELCKHQDFVTVWMFRHVRTGNLCFVICPRRLPVFEAFMRKRTRRTEQN